MADSSHVSRDTASHAAAALLKWMRDRDAGGKPQLLDDDRSIVLLVSLRRFPAAPRFKPYLLRLPHRTLPSSPSVCLIADDRAAPVPTADLTAAAAAAGVPLAAVIGLTELRSDYHPFEARRRLLASHDLFVADRRIIPLLPRLIGKHFFSSKKAPQAIQLSRAGWPKQLQSILDSSSFYIRSGTCCAAKVGRLDMDVDALVDNIMTAVELAVQLVPKRWAGVRSLHIRSVDSMALPIYQAVPEAPMRISWPEPENSDLGTGEVVDGKNEKGTRKRERGGKLAADADKEIGRGKKGQKAVTACEAKEEEEENENQVLRKKKTKANIEKEDDNPEVANPGTNEGKKKCKSAAKHMEKEEDEGGKVASPAASESKKKRKNATKQMEKDLRCKEELETSIKIKGGNKSGAKKSAKKAKIEG